MTRLKYVFLFILYCCTSLFSPAQALEGITDPAQIPAENFFKENTEFSYRISPDGKQLAFIRKYTQTYNIVITDLEKFVEVHEFAVSKNVPEQLTWISNSRLVFGVGGVIYSVNQDGADLRVLLSNIYDADKVKGYISFVKNLRYWSLLKRPRGNEEDVLFLSYNSDGHANVHKINIYTGEKTDLYEAKKLKADGLYTDRDGKVILVEKVKKEQHSFYRLAGEQNNLELASIDIANHSYQLNYDAKSYLNRSVVVHEIGYDKDTMYLSEKTSGDRYQLVKYNYVTNAKEVIGSDPVYDVGSPDERASLYYDHKNRKLVGFSYNADKRKTVWLDERFKRYQQSLDKTYPDQTNQIYDWNESADKLLVISSDAKTKGKIIVFDTIKNKTIVQTDYSSILSPAHMKDTEIYKYKTQDGTNITSYLTPPAKATSSKWPLIVMPHGGPFSRSYYGYDGHMQYFSTRGYAVLEPNFRGSTGYGVQHLLAGKQQIADLMLSDIADGVGALIKENKVDPSQVYILGFSYGGYAAIMSAIKYPDLYSAAVSAAAPLDLNEQLKHYKKEERWFAYEFWQDVIGAKQQGKKFVESISPYHRAEEIKIPLLIFHGDRDNIIPKEQAEDFKKLAEKKKLNIPVRIIQSEGHGWDLVSSNTYFAEKSVELFKANKKVIH
ncbi:alpha/beta fold hydrolase [Cellvibrio sp. NN19]|uniref:S9 family peptidase n=1 Tax=Cellvibrio chitinivorans TaxID=3102792 RepID=UPI002B40AC4F|nr:alpha/beta fold hydrolase [Cellvibrio sp. NN19]